MILFATALDPSILMYTAPDPTYKEKEVLPIQAENAKTPVQVTDAEGSSSGGCYIQFVCKLHAMG